MNYLDIRKQRSCELKRLRLDAGLTQIDLGKKANIAHTTIRAIETSSHAWSIDSEILYIQACVNHLKTKNANNYVGRFENYGL